MKLRSSVLVVLIFLSLASFAHDSIRSSKGKSGFKLGAKIIAERSGLLNLVPGTYPVYGCGIQFIKPIKRTHFSIESGFYLVTKALAYNNSLDPYTYRALYRHLSIPLNGRFDYKYFYFSLGPTCDYFIEQDLSEWMNQSALYTRKLFLGINSNVGVQYPLRSGMMIFVEGRYSKIMKLKLSDPPFTNFGFAFGFNYHLGARSKKATALYTQ